ncbi:hypothetical protein R3I93_014238 [Phoxinus phoxinus]|uniref:Uncharacterized protein n=1 Tax=Phoxinus phoxinus TaxID=58324 RepID=A0AAN9CSP1_9TELE
MTCACSAVIKVFEDDNKNSKKIKCIEIIDHHIMIN